jgi:anionic cell wall polymer biosynthesis LytR-Cps2A-Psr (LCP) family protein
VVDPRADLDLPAGEHLLEGEQALGFVRTRHAIGDGSDLGRIGRQQQFLASMARTAESKLTDPAALYGFLEAATSSITTDSGLGSLAALGSLAQSVSSLDPAHLQFFTVPNHPRGDVVKGDRANVLWSQPAAGALFSDLEHDVDPTTSSAAPAPSATASASAAPAATTAPAPATTGADTACTPT